MSGGWLVSLVPIAVLAAGGGAHPSWTLPILAAAAAAFLGSRARVASGDARWLDIALLTLLGAAAVQVLPLPRGTLAAVSPHVEALRAAWSVDPASAPPTISVDPRLTRAGVAYLASALLLFWAARETFARGGARAAARIVAWAALGVTVLAAAHRAAPGPFAGIWAPAEAGSRPLGPFVNRNHFATWLLMAAALAAGYLVAHVRSLGPPRPALRLRFRDRLADGRGLVLAGALVAAIGTLAATQSRSAILGAGVALGVTLLAVPRSRFHVPGSRSGSASQVPDSGLPAADSARVHTSASSRRGWFPVSYWRAGSWLSSGGCDRSEWGRAGNPEQEPGTRTLEFGTARLLLASVAVLLACAVWTNRDALASKFEATPSVARLTIWRETLPVVRDFWAAGTGLGTYGPVMLRYQQTSRDVHFNQAHSEYLQVAAEGGLLVTMPFLAAIVAALRLARRRLREDRRVTRWVRVGAAAGLAGVAVQSVFETGLRVPANALLAALLAAVVLCEPRRR